VTPTRLLRACPLLAALVLLGPGCTLTHLDEHFGEAQRANVAAMTENPAAAEQDRESPQGLDGASASRVMEKYQKKQGEKKAQRLPSIIQIDAGGRR
jgi:hypothetical protein